MPNKANKTLLVVYDSQSIRETVNIFGLDGSFRVVELADADRLEAVLEAETPDLVLLCAMTRQTIAYDLCRRIKERAAHAYLPVLLYSLRVGPAEYERALEVGADDVVQVTISPELLQYRIASHLRVGETVRRSQAQLRSIARASAEAADIMLRLEEANRRIQEQNEELERMVKRLEERDARIREQQKQIEAHLKTLRRELRLAASLQAELMPQALPREPGFSVHSRYVPAADLGGDYYDLVHRPDGRIHLSVADVTGHGVAAALVSVHVRAVARAGLERGAALPELLGELNRTVRHTYGGEFLLTLLALEFDPQTHRVRVVGAGHCPLIHLPAADGEAREVPSRGLPLGVTDAATYEEDVFTLLEGDRLLLYTDGVTEARRRDNHAMYGPERLIRTLAGCRGTGGEQTLDAILGSARKHMRREGFEDDVTLVLLDRSEGI